MKSADYYDSIASGYDELHGDEQLLKLRVIKEHISIKKDDIIADIGGGTGLAAHVFPNKIITIDPSKELLKRAPAPAVIGTMEQIPLRDKTADWVFCVSAFHHTTNPDKACEEFKRIGKGKYVITLLKKSPKKDALKKIILGHFQRVDSIENHHDEILVLKD